jgi:FkbM family methyltransferase
MTRLSQAAGLLRSLALYYGHPLRHRRLMRLYAPFIQPDKLVFDIGAHVGNHSRAFLALGAFVVAVEPQPLFSAFLSRIFNKHADFVLKDFAIGATVGDTELYLSSRTPTVSTIAGDWMKRMGGSPTFEKVQWDERVPVKLSTLDRLISKYGEPSFVKIDVEGGEADVLAGLSVPVKTICFEVLPYAKDTGISCVIRLAQLGNYQYNWSEGETAHLQPAWVDAEGIKARLHALSSSDREINVFAQRN